MEFRELKTFVVKEIIKTNFGCENLSKEQVHEASTIIENKVLQIVEVDAQTTED